MGRSFCARKMQLLAGETSTPPTPPHAGEVSTPPPRAELGHALACTYNDSGNEAAVARPTVGAASTVAAALQPDPDPDTGSDLALLKHTGIASEDAVVTPADHDIDADAGADGDADVGTDVDADVGTDSDDSASTSDPDSDGASDADDGPAPTLGPDTAEPANRAGIGIGVAVGGTGLNSGVAETAAALAVVVPRDARTAAVAAWWAVVGALVALVLAAALSRRGSVGDQRGVAIGQNQPGVAGDVAPHLDDATRRALAAPDMRVLDARRTAAAPLAHRYPVTPCTPVFGHDGVGDQRGSVGAQRDVAVGGGDRRGAVGDQRGASASAAVHEIVRDLAVYLAVAAAAGPRAQTRALTAQHVGARPCVVVVRMGHGGPGGALTLALADPRIVAASVERRPSTEHDTLCGIDMAAHFMRPRHITVRHASLDGRVYEREFEGDDAAAVAHALDVLAALRVCTVV